MTCRLGWADNIHTLEGVSGKIGWVIMLCLLFCEFKTYDTLILLLALGRGRGSLLRTSPLQKIYPFINHSILSVRLETIFWQIVAEDDDIEVVMVRLDKIDNDRGGIWCSFETTWKDRFAANGGNSIIGIKLGEVKKHMISFHKCKYWIFCWQEYCW